MTKQLVSVVRPVERGSVLTKVIVAMLTSLLLLMSLMPTLARPAEAQAEPPEGIVEVGPINPENGFPYWYEDADGTRLELCLDPDDQMCLQPFESPDPTGAVSFPDNFPGEAFWWAADAEIALPNGEAAQLVLANEAAFATEEAGAGEQVNFGRIRIRIDGLVTGETYTVTHPYGTDTFVAEDNGRIDERQAGEINFTQDLGCAAGALAPCDFEEMVSGKNRIGPFLKWTEGAPEGYVGDPNVPHEVTGSPYDTNFFRVEGPNIGGPGVNSVETNLFNVSGKIATQQVTPSVKGGTYNEVQDVELVASDPQATVYYTTDGTDPTTQSATYDDQPISVGQTTTLKFMSVGADGEQSRVYTETYTIDTVSPSVNASPEPVLYEPLTGPTDVTLSSNQDARIFYTTDGSTPTENSNEFVAGTPIKVDRSQTIKAIAINDNGRSQVKTFDYKVPSLAEIGPENDSGGYPSWLQDAGIQNEAGETVRNPLRLELCLDPDDPMCLTPFESPNPTGAVSFPDNFPGESFWFAADAEMTLPSGGDARLVLANEAAFISEEAKEGDQVAFGRVRIRIDGLENRAYKITHPYGTDTFQAEDDGKGGWEINFTEDLGCMMPSSATGCNFDEARFSRVGPFLTWDTFGTDSPNAPPAGYVGNPGVPHRVTGSPYDTNIFKVEELDAEGNVRGTLQETDLFSISGKIAGPTAKATPKGGPNPVASQQVTLTAKDTSDAAGTPEIFYTTASAEEMPDAQIATGGTPYNGPIDIDESTTLRFVAVNSAGVQSRFYTENYTVDTQAPTVSANVADGVFNAPQVVTLTANDGPATAGFGALSSNSDPAPVESDGESKIYYTTDGSNPSTGSVLYNDPIRVDKTQTIKAIAVDAAGNQSEVASFEYVIDTIAPNAPTADLPEGTYDAAQSLSFTSEAGSEIRYTTNGDTPDKSSALYSGPTQVARTTTFKAIAFDAAGNASPVLEHTITIRTATRTNLGVASANLKLGKTRAVAVSVSPNQASGKVTVTIDRPGALSTITKRGTLNATSRYGFTYKPTAAGAYRIKATFAEDADALGSTSVVKSFRVVRR